MHMDVLPGVQRMLRRFAFRYVKIEVIDLSSKYSLIIDDAYVDSVSSADDSSIEVFHGTEMEERIDQIAIRTLHNCMQDVFEDGPKRDRRLWIGDLRLQALANAATYRNYDLVKRCLYLFAGCTDEDGRVPACLFLKPEITGDDTYMFDYSLFFIAALEDYVFYSKDYETGRDLADVAIRQWKLASRNFGEDHVIKDSDQIGWCFIDWNLDLNKQASAQFVYIYSLKKLTALLQMLDEQHLRDFSENESQELREEIQAKSRAAVKSFYQENQGLFISGSNQQISYATQSWAVLAGVFSEEKNRELLLRLKENDRAHKMVTPYMNHVYVEALMEAGMLREAYEHMIYYWGGMVEDGADTFYELFNPENPEESPYGSCMVNSYCHAWSCTPTYLMRIKLLREECL